jgi:hypothetical protein
MYNNILLQNKFTNKKMKNKRNPKTKIIIIIVKIIINK